MVDEPDTLYIVCREEEKELERRIALVAKAQARSNKKGPTQDNSNPQPSVEPSVVSTSSTVDNERKHRITKAIEVAEARFVGHNLKVSL